MVCERRLEHYTLSVTEFAAAAGRSVNEGADEFCAYVHKLGSFDLAVLNVGEHLFRRVLGSEATISRDERREYPNVAESIAVARGRCPKPPGF